MVSTKKNFIDQMRTKCVFVKEGLLNNQLNEPGARVRWRSPASHQVNFSQRVGEAVFLTQTPL